MVDVRFSVPPYLKFKKQKGISAGSGLSKLNKFCLPIELTYYLKEKEKMIWNQAICHHGPVGDIVRYCRVAAGIWL